MSAYDQVRQLMSDARAYNQAVEQYAAQMASMLRGKLRFASASDVAALKRELRDFNLTTHEWKDKP